MTLSVRTQHSGVKDVGPLVWADTISKLHWCNYSLRTGQRITSVIMLAHQAHTAQDAKEVNTQNIGEGGRVIRPRQTISHCGFVVMLVPTRAAYFIPPFCALEILELNIMEY